MHPLENLSSQDYDTAENIYWMLKQVMNEFESITSDSDAFDDIYNGIDEAKINLAIMLEQYHNIIDA